MRLQVPGLLLAALTVVSLAFLMVFWTPAGLAVLAILLLVLAAREFSRVIMPAAGRARPAPHAGLTAAARALRRHRDRALRDPVMTSRWAGWSLTSGEELACEGQRRLGHRQDCRHIRRNAFADGIFAHNQVASAGADAIHVNNTTRMEHRWATICTAMAMTASAATPSPVSVRAAP